MASREASGSREGDSNERSVTEKFCAITGATEELAERLLEACGGNIDLAIGMHLDCQDDKDEPPRPEATEDDAGEVRAPIPQKNETLVEETNIIPAFGRRKRTTNCIFDALRDFEAESRIQDEGEVGTSGTAANKRRTLQDLFRPPIDLIHKGTFHSIRAAASQANKWLLINIQDAQEFCCQVLNRDVWSSAKVKAIVRSHFLFWQGYHDSSEGQRFMQFYDISTWPYIAVLDPRTGEKMTVWHSLDADSLVDLLKEFTEQHPAPDGSTVEPPDKVQRRRDSIIDASEDSQLEAAIRLSLAEPSKATCPKPALSDTDDTDEDDDLLETFSSSNSDAESPKKSYHSTASSPVKKSSLKNSSVKKSYAAAAAAGSESEAASGHNQSEAGVSQSEAGASNYVNGTTCTVTTPDVVPRSQGNSMGMLKLDSDGTRKILPCGETDTSIGEGTQPEKSVIGQGSTDNESTSRVQIRFPDGLRKVLTLSKHSSLQTLTEFVAKQGYAAVNYKLVATFPKRQLSQMDSTSTLADIGFCSQEIVYVESLS